MEKRSLLDALSRSHSPSRESIVAKLTRFFETFSRDARLWRDVPNRMPLGTVVREGDDGISEK